MSDEICTYRSDNPVTQNPRFRRRITEIRRPFAGLVENMFDLTLECGHEPLAFTGGDVADPAVGDMAFCPDCYHGEPV